MSGDAAGDDQSEVVEIGATLKRKAVARDPAGDADADRGQLVVADPRARSGPGMRPAVTPNAAAMRIITSSRSRTYRCTSQRSGLQIDDRIADELAGTVVGDVAAAPRLEDSTPSAASASGALRARASGRSAP